MLQSGVCALELERMKRENRQDDGRDPPDKVLQSHSQPSGETSMQSGPDVSSPAPTGTRRGGLRSILGLPGRRRAGR